MTNATISLRLADSATELTLRAAERRPDLASAFDDDGWLAVHVVDTLIARDGVAFAAGEVALARPAVARHPSDFIVFSERLGRMVGLRHGTHVVFGDELEERVA